MKRKLLSIICLISICIGAAACGSQVSPETSTQTAEAEVENTIADEASDESETAEVEAISLDESESAETDEELSAPKQVIVYFPNWKLESENGKVSDIPWDKITIINHAFWAVAPDGESQETSWERRSAGLKARTEYKIVSTLPEADAQIFPEYAEYSKQYPDVNILISVGGWNACGYFSEMAYTPEGRASFIASCINLINENPWIDGIDIDWEYPAGSNDGERLPENEIDQGCPIWGTPQEDRDNFAAFVFELKDALNENFGEGNKLLTACASASTGWTLPNQDWVAAADALDYINIMTYDMAGDWDKATGHASSVQVAKTALGFFIHKKIDTTKLNIGSPFYGTGFMMAEDVNFKYPLHANIDVPNGIDKEQLTMSFICQCEADAVAEEEIGWHTGYDAKQGGAYIYNNDPDSEYYRWFVSYEVPDSLDGKFELINKYNLAGIIVWEVSQDTLDHEMINHIADNLR